MSRNQTRAVHTNPLAIDALLEQELQNRAFCSESISQRAQPLDPTAPRKWKLALQVMSNHLSQEAHQYKEESVHSLAGQSQVSHVLKAHLQRKHRHPKDCGTPWDTLFWKPCHLGLDLQTDKCPWKTSVNLGCGARCVLLVATTSRNGW